MITETMENGKYSAEMFGYKLTNKEKKLLTEYHKLKIEVIKAQETANEKLTEIIHSMRKRIKDFDKKVRNKTRGN